MKMKVDLSKFKLRSKDDKVAVLEHPDGHTVHIAINALHPLNRKNFDKLEKCDGGMMADGGPVAKPSPKPTKNDNNYQVGVEGSLGNKITKAAQRLVSGLAHGGKVSEKEIYSIHNNPKLEQSKVRLADGGDVQQQDQLNQLLTDTNAQLQPSMGADDQATTPVPLPPGTPIDQTQAAQENNGFVDLLKQGASKLGDVVNTGFQGLKSGITGSLAEENQPVQENSQMSPQSGQLAPAMNSEPAKEEPKAEQAPSLPGMDKEVAGINQQAKAIEDQSMRDQEVLTSAGLAAEKLKTHYDIQSAQLENERQSLIHDINEGHIDPNHYLGNQNTGQKIATGISILLGGLSGKGGVNPGVEYLQKEIDRDIEAQKANLQSKESLLSANLKQFGNLHDATAMTKAMMNDQAVNQLQKSAAIAKTPMAQAAALQAIGQLQAQSAPLMQQMAIRKTLQQLNSNPQSGLIKQDPATLVPQVVPKEQQKEVFNEIKAAQNTKHMSQSIMKAFDDAAKENTVMKTGAGLLRTPASVYSLHQNMQPTFADLEGTVRQAAMDNTFKNITPMPGDAAHTIEQKKQALQEYLQSKASAPTAKGFGIDLSKFDSTNTDPKAHIFNTLSPKQKSFVDWAQKNPQNPDSAIILKKLGLE